jgi:hypothetical protein
MVDYWLRSQKWGAMNSSDRAPPLNLSQRSVSSIAYTEAGDVLPRPCKDAAHQYSFKPNWIWRGFPAVLIVGNVP